MLAWRHEVKGCCAQEEVSQEESISRVANPKLSQKLASEEVERYTDEEAGEKVSTDKDKQAAARGATQRITMETEKQLAGDGPGDKAECEQLAERQRARSQEELTQARRCVRSFYSPPTDYAPVRGHGVVQNQFIRVRRLSYV
jgi:hypothetical protein